MEGFSGNYMFLAMLQKYSLNVSAISLSFVAEIFIGFLQFFHH